MRKNIGYHTRLDSNNTVKVCGGSFGGSFDWETVERLVKAHFTVKIQPSGRAVFVDKEGRAVSLYFSVDPDMTLAGKAALAEDRKAREEAQRIEDEKQGQIDELMSGLSNDEIIRRLTQG